MKSVDPAIPTSTHAKSNTNSSWHGELPRARSNRARTKCQKFATGLIPKRCQWRRRSPWSNRASDDRPMVPSTLRSNWANQLTRARWWAHWSGNGRIVLMHSDRRNKRKHVKTRTTRVWRTGPFEAIDGITPYPVQSWHNNNNKNVTLSSLSPSHTHTYTHTFSYPSTTTTTIKLPLPRLTHNGLLLPLRLGYYYKR